MGLNMNIFNDEPWTNNDHFKGLFQRNSSMKTTFNYLNVFQNGGCYFEKY